MPLPPKDKVEKKSFVTKMAFPLFFVVLFASLIIFRKPIWGIFQSPEELRDWVIGWGVFAPLIFILIQILQVVIFIIPGQVPQLAGGYLFGLWPGFLYSFLGIAIGSTINFFLARWLGVPFVRLLFSEDKITRIEKIATSIHAKIAFFLCFLIPGIPLDILCYVAGLTPMSYMYFFSVSMLGRIPGLFGSVLIGASAAEKRWPLVIVLSASAIVLFVVGFLLRNKIQSVIVRFTGSGKEDTRGRYKITK
jgi:uncharacterized membrane protein YdjX (TVP38/TMEM64 family)